jgi:hypothetical protein
VPIWHAAIAPDPQSSERFEPENSSAAQPGRALLTYLVLGSVMQLPAIAAATATTAAATTAPTAAFAVVTTTAAAAAVVTATATAVAAALPAATATAVATATAPEATAAAAEAAAAAAEATAAAAAARLALFRFVHAKRATVERTAIHPLDRLGGFLGAAHGHESKAARAAGLAIRDQVDITDRSELLERGTYPFCVGVER